MFSKARQFFSEPAEFVIYKNKCNMIVKVDLITNRSLLISVLTLYLHSCHLMNLSSFQDLTN